MPGTPVAFDDAETSVALTRSIGGETWTVRICCGWWKRIAGLTAGCTCRGGATSSADLSVYSITQDRKVFRMVGPEWTEDSVGILHGTSVDEPSGSVVVRRPDGQVIAIKGLDSSGDVLNRPCEHVAVKPASRIRAQRPAPELIQRQRDWRLQDPRSPSRSMSSAAGRQSHSGSLWRSASAAVWLA